MTDHLTRYGLSESSGFNNSIGPSLSLVSTLVIAMLTMLLLVTGAVPQLEMALFGGNIPIPFSVVNGLLFSAIAFGVLTTKRIRTKHPLFQSMLLLALYLVIDAIYLNINEGLSPSEIYRTFMGLFSVLFLAAICELWGFRVDENIFITMILFMFIVNAVIGIAQYATNMPILPTESIDRSFIVHVYSFGGVRERAFGLFPTGALLGLFCSLAGSFGVAHCKNLKGALVGMPIIILAGFCCFATLTRAVMVIYICALLSACFIGKKRWRAIAAWLPLVWASLVVPIVFITLKGSVSSNSLNSNDSMFMRLAAWQSSYASFISATIPEQLFGIGIVPFTENIAASGRLEHISPTKISAFPIDNVTLILLLYVGLVGVIFVSFVLIICWQVVLRKAKSNPSPLQISLASLCSTFLLSSVLDSTIGFYSAIFMIAVLNKSNKVVTRLDVSLAAKEDQLM